MKLHDLKPAPGSTHRKRRVGRGISAGQGKTAGRGTKGQRARTGRRLKLYFEGGQNPLVRRLPHKRGFTNIFKIEYEVINLDGLNTKFDTGAQVTPALIVERGLAKHADRVKVLGDGELKKALTVQAHAFSKSAQEKIAAAGGRAEVISDQ
ncbi:MAG: 50S ribosomal protein L15 [Chloroflexi bacterium]|nr:50S ribosomal protein L15 [Chloroflexota bacterium]